MQCSCLRHRWPRRRCRRCASGECSRNCQLAWVGHRVRSHVTCLLRSPLTVTQRSRCRLHSNDCYGYPSHQLSHSDGECCSLGLNPMLTGLQDSGSADFWVGSENCKSEDGGTCVCSFVIFAALILIVCRESIISLVRLLPAHSRTPKLHLSA